MPIKSPKEMAKDMVECSIPKTALSVDRLLLLGVLAGVYIAFGGVLMTRVILDTAQFLGAGISNLLGGAVFSVGLMLVVIGGAELFTGNCLVPMAVLEGVVPPRGLVKNWTVVYIGNAIGSVFLAFLLWIADLYTGNLLNLAVNLAIGKVQIGWIQVVARGILCNWLVCLAVWLSLSADTTTGKITSIFFPIMAFVASGFEHSIANMFFLANGMLLGMFNGASYTGGLDLSALNLQNIIFNNIVPATIGNIIGGVLFVACIYWYIYLKE
ncbi:MAG: formate/nitrite transporter family protein [Candidatus Ranarchaeia archaeon]|jgi:formate/nitrite transporter